MLSCFDAIRGNDYGSLLLRLLIATLCGTLIGLERSMKNRPAGFRTHILVCLGGAVAAATGHFLYLGLHLPADVTRLSGQVITGLGFIGAGTIIVTKRMSIKGLTTAAGLWAMSAIGLVCGAGYLELAYFSTAMVLVAELVLSKFEYRYVRRIEDMHLYIEYKHTVCIEEIMEVLRRQNIPITDLEVTRINDGDAHRYCAVVEIQVNKDKLDGALMQELNAIEDVTNIEEL